MAPKHYLKQYHPNTTRRSSGKATGSTEHDAKLDWPINPDCPTMTGWRLKTYQEGRSVVLERNPYYYVRRHGRHQLPYIDEIRFSVVQDAEVAEAAVRRRARSTTPTAASPLVTLATISGLKRPSTARRCASLLGQRVGTGSIFFFNYDYPEPKMRELIREPKFRQALSHAFNRDGRPQVHLLQHRRDDHRHAQPQGHEFTDRRPGPSSSTGDGATPTSTYDPAKAKSMLDELGVVDKDGDGCASCPTAGSSVIRIDYPGRRQRRAHPEEQPAEARLGGRRDHGHRSTRSRRRPSPTSGVAAS